MTPEYGTKEYYCDMFSDFIADVDPDRPATSENIIEGFKLALKGWHEYHVQMVDQLESMQKKVDEEI